MRSPKAVLGSPARVQGGGSYSGGSPFVGFTSPGGTRGPMSFDSAPGESGKFSHVRVIQSESAASLAAMKQPLGVTYPWSPAPEVAESLFTMDGLTHEIHHQLKMFGDQMTKGGMAELMRINYTAPATAEQLKNWKTRRAMELKESWPDIPLNDEGTAKLPHRPYYQPMVLSSASYGPELKKPQLPEKVVSTVDGILKSFSAPLDSLSHLATMNVQEQQMLLEFLEKNDELDDQRDVIQRLSTIVMNQQMVFRELAFQASKAMTGPILRATSGPAPTIGAAVMLSEQQRLQRQKSSAGRPSEEGASDRAKKKARQHQQSDRSGERLVVPKKVRPRYSQGSPVSKGRQHSPGSGGRNTGRGKGDSSAGSKKQGRDDRSFGRGVGRGGNGDRRRGGGDRGDTRDRQDTGGRGSEARGKGNRSEGAERDRKSGGGRDRGRKSDPRRK